MSGLLGGIGRTLFQLGCEISPIILCNGLAGAVPGGMLPIVAITEAASFAQGLLGGGDALDPDNYLCHFRPAGSTLIDYLVAEYPFANMTVAANAVIAQPLKISLIMDAPARGPGAYGIKLLTLTALQATLNKHILMGGTFTVVLPFMIYTNCLLTQLRDATAGGSDKQPMVSYQFDFTQPLVTQQAAAQVQSSALSNITNGLPGTTSWSGPSAVSGSTLAAPGTSPGAGNLAGTSVLPGNYSGPVSNT